jgi:hypothetical protein
MAGLAGAGGFANLPAEIPGLIAFGWFGFDFQQHRLVEVKNKNLLILTDKENMIIDSRYRQS